MEQETTNQHHVSDEKNQFLDEEYKRKCQEYQELLEKYTLALRNIKEANGIIHLVAQVGESYIREVGASDLIDAGVKVILTTANRLKGLGFDL